MTPPPVRGQARIPAPDASGLPTPGAAVVQPAAGRDRARSPAWQRDAALALAGLLLLLVWDASGADLWLSARYGGSAGFALRQGFWTRDVLHDGGRWLAWALLAALVADAVRPWWPGPPRRQRALAVLAVLATMLFVSGLKRASATSCPWDLAPFGGAFAYVPHWDWRTLDGGPGHCFPSGHAVSAFGFLGVHFLWRDHAQRAARAALVATLAAGALFGWAQLARGAHFASHTLWTGWLCWAFGSVVAAAAQTRRPRPSQAG